MVLTHPEIVPQRNHWLGRQDSNLGMAESKSTCFAFDFNDHSEKSANFDGASPLRGSLVSIGSPDRSN